MGKTTIQLDDRTKQRLDKRKHEKETYDEAVNRILDDDDAGVLHTEEDIREMARAEAKDMIRQCGGQR